jgi:hypothetical protein
MAEESQNNFDEQFISDSISYESYRGASKPYSGSEYQMKTYDSLLKDDQNYKQFITRAYGSYENYKLMNKAFTKGSVFDPTVDYMMDVTVITDDTYYKSDHISASEVIMESLSGICSFNFIKKDGSPAKVNGTIDQRFVPPVESQTRNNFFSPLPGDRIVVWDINKQHWASFYMSRLFKFVRDDTTDIE